MPPLPPAVERSTGRYHIGETMPLVSTARAALCPRRSAMPAAGDMSYACPGRRTMKPVSDVHELFRRQRAIRSFTDEDVPDALVDQVLTAAIHGPSGSNTQPWHFIVIRDQTVKRAISEVYEEAR